MRLRNKIAFIFLVAVLTAAFGVTVYAVPANPFPRLVRQADGSVITVTGFGDEFFNWTEDDSGYVVKYDEASKDWRYAYIKNGKIMPGEVSVGKQANSLERSVADRSGGKITRKDLAPLIADVDKSANVEHINEPMPIAASAVNQSSGAIPDNKLKQDMLVMLVEFNDAHMVKGMDYWRNHHFGTNGKTVNAYFAEVSGAKNFQFRPITFNVGNRLIKNIPGTTEVEIRDGVARVRLDRKHPGFNDDVTLINYEIELAFDKIKQFVNLDRYTDRYENYIKREDFHVSAIVAGWEASSGDSNDKNQRVWAHASYAYVDIASNHVALSVDVTDTKNPKLLSFACQGEVYHGERLDQTAIVMGVGITAHELGHSLGLPDLYDYGYDSPGVGLFSLMASGSWGAGPGDEDGYTPVHLDAWSKAKLGFIKPTMIPSSEHKTINVSSFDKGYNVYKITSDVNPKQYFLIENRQQIGFDKGMYWFGLKFEYNNDGGILIYHIDEEVEAARGMINSNQNHKAVDVEESGGLDGGFFYTFYTKNGYFNADKTPNSNFYTPGHTQANGGSGDKYLDDDECHPQTVASGISIRVNSDRASTMEVEVGELSAAEPPNILKDLSGKVTYKQNATAKPMIVDAQVRDGGTVSYQWYTNTVKNTTGGALIPGATTPSLTPTTSALGTLFYYVIATNTQGGNMSSTTSGIKEVEINTQDNAEQPVFDIDLYVIYEYMLNDEAEPMAVSASVSDGGDLSYQWYVNTSLSNIGGTLIPGANASAYTPPTTSVGRVYYYVQVTNTNTGVNGVQTATSTSHLASIWVLGSTSDAQKPIITNNLPQKAIYGINTAGSPLSVMAYVLDGGTLTYQWHRNTVASMDGMTPIDGATYETFAPPTIDEGTYYYCVKITNNNPYAVGEKTAQTTSSITTVEVTRSDLYSLTLAAGANGSVQPDVNGQYAAGQNVTIAAVPDEGYLFEGWSSSAGGEFGDATSASTTFIMPQSDTTVSASFIKANGAEPTPIPTPSPTPSPGAAPSYQSPQLIPPPPGIHNIPAPTPAAYVASLGTPQASKAPPERVTTSPIRDNSVVKITGSKTSAYVGIDTIREVAKKPGTRLKITLRSAIVTLDWESVSSIAEQTNSGVTFTVTGTGRNSRLNITSAGKTISDLGYGITDVEIR